MTYRMYLPSSTLCQWHVSAVYHHRHYFMEFNRVYAIDGSVLELFIYLPSITLSHSFLIYSPLKILSSWIVSRIYHYINLVHALPMHWIVSRILSFTASHYPSNMPGLFSLFAITDITDIISRNSVASLLLPALSLNCSWICR